MENLRCQFTGRIEFKYVNRMEIETFCSKGS